jgi:LemA protein
MFLEKKGFYITNFINKLICLIFMFENILFGILIFLILWIVYIYNSLISARNYVKKSFSGIDVQLKRRNDLIPNLVNVVKGYAKHESELFKSITKTRSSIIKSIENKDLNQLSKNNNLIEKSLKNLFMVAENYPKLKANETFLKLQEQLQETEDQIAASRRIFNENVTYYNNKIQYFPNNLITNIFKFEKEVLFKD